MSLKDDVIDMVLSIGAGTIEAIKKSKRLDKINDIKLLIALKEAGFDMNTISFSDWLENHSIYIEGALSQRAETSGDLGLSWKFIEGGFSKKKMEQSGVKITLGLHFRDMTEPEYEVLKGMDIDDSKKLVEVLENFEL